MQDFVRNSSQTSTLREGSSSPFPSPVFVCFHDSPSELKWFTCLLEFCSLRLSSNVDWSFHVPNLLQISQKKKTLLLICIRLALEKFGSSTRLEISLAI